MNDWGLVVSINSKCNINTDELKNQYATDFGFYHNTQLQNVNVIKLRSLLFSILFFFFVDFFFVIKSKSIGLSVVNRKFWHSFFLKVKFIVCCMNCKYTKYLPYGLHEVKRRREPIDKGKFSNFLLNARIKRLFIIISIRFGIFPIHFPSIHPSVFYLFGFYSTLDFVCAVCRSFQQTSRKNILHVVMSTVACQCRSKINSNNMYFLLMRFSFSLSLSPLQISLHIRFRFQNVLESHIFVSIRFSVTKANIRGICLCVCVCTMCMHKALYKHKYIVVA